MSSINNERKLLASDVSLNRQQVLDITDKDFKEQDEPIEIEN
jgi:hypothetical protein